MLTMNPRWSVKKQHENACKLLFHNHLQNLRSKFHKDVMFTWQQKTRGFLWTCSLKIDYCKIRSPVGLKIWPIPISMTYLWYDRPVFGWLNCHSNYLASGTIAASAKCTSLSLLVFFLSRQGGSFGDLSASWLMFSGYARCVWAMVHVEFLGSRYRRWLPASCTYKSRS